jgi:glycosyltransferase involved in cell wall biosynthesis
VKPLFVDLETAWRGGQNQALLTLKGLVARGHHPELIAAEGAALGERARQAGIPVHFTRRGLAQLPSALAIRRLLKEHKFDLLHANEAHALSAAWLARAHQQAPLVVSRRVGYPIRRSKIARARYQAAAKIIANSRWVAEQAICSGAPRDKVVIVHEGTEIPQPFTAGERARARRKWHQPEGAPLLGCVGVLLPDKGQEWLIRAVAELYDEFAGVRLLLAGDGPCRPMLEKLARQLDISAAVIFAGFVSDVASVYAALDVFLLPSFFEALNNSLLAAMAYGIPSIAFRKGALGEIVEDGASGLLTEPADVRALSASIRKLLGDPLLSHRLGENGRRRVAEHFSAEQMIEGTLSVYREVVVGSS